MKIFKKLSWLIPAFSILFFACAVITVNIYFPEKEVKKAFNGLEEELVNESTPPSDKKDEKSPKPQSYLYENIMQKAADTFTITPAYAGQDITQLLKEMPDVMSAHERMKGRRAVINELKAKGLVGEGNRGYLVPRGSLSPSDAVTMDTENNDRKIVITGMAKAILKINKQPETSANINQLIPKAEKEYADTKSSYAKPGTWLQEPSGNWKKK